MSSYRITGSYRGEDAQAGESKSAAVALGMFRAASKPGGLPITAIRITDPDGIEIDAAELERRAESERHA
jgi:hypothetical protein